MRFQSVFIAVTVSAALIVAAALVTSKRPAVEVDQPTAAAVKATGKCASCHRKETAAVVHQFEKTAHARAGITCLDCHGPAEGQKGDDHRGFEITAGVTSKNCAKCHRTQYDQFERSRHGAPAWAAVAGSADFSEAQIALAEKYHPGAVKRPPNALAMREGEGARPLGCEGCHDIGKPNADGSVGQCTDCHSRHSTSVALARMPSTCGQCHMGPDHSQLEIYRESKHGALFEAQRNQLNLDADPKKLSAADMPVPTCATCHMSGLEGAKFTHDVTERLSWFLFAPVSKKRQGYARGQDEMRGICSKCHTKPQIERVYREAEVVVNATNRKVEATQKLMADLRREGLLTPTPFDEPIEFMAFDHWHYFGRTAKHGAFMGGADFVQWHGNYELLLLEKEIEAEAKELRAEHAGETLEDDG